MNDLDYNYLVETRTLLPTVPTNQWKIIIWELTRKVKLVLFADHEVIHESTISFVYIFKVLS